MVRSCEISIFRAILSLQIFILEFKNGLLEIISMRFLRRWGSMGVGGGIWVVVIGDSAGLVQNVVTSCHDTCVFYLSFLAELLLDLVGSFTGRSMMVRSF